MVAAWRNVAIQEEGLRNSQAQAASNARLAARGAVAPTDIVEANTQVNVFQDNVFSALQNVQRLQTQLKSLILANPADPVWFANLVPTTAIAQIPQEPSLDALIDSAIANRPEIAQLRSQRQNANSNLAYARDQLAPADRPRPGLHVERFRGQPVDPTTNPIFGLFGAQINAINALIARSNAQNPGSPPIAPVTGGFGALPPYQTGKLGQSFQNLIDNRFPTYSAQLTFAVPFGNRTAKADYAIAQEQARQVALQETAVLQRIRSESVNAIQGLREAQYRVIAARAAREAVAARAARRAAPLPSRHLDDVPRAAAPARRRQPARPRAAGADRPRQSDRRAEPRERRHLRPERHRRQRPRRHDAERGDADAERPAARVERDGAAGYSTICTLIRSSQLRMSISS